VGGTVFAAADGRETSKEESVSMDHDTPTYTSNRQPHRSPMYTRNPHPLFQNDTILSLKRLHSQNLNGFTHNLIHLQYLKLELNSRHSLMLCRSSNLRNPGHFTLHEEFMFRLIFGVVI